MTSAIISSSSTSSIRTPVSFPYLSGAAPSDSIGSGTQGRCSGGTTGCCLLPRRNGKRDGKGAVTVIRQKNHLISELFHQVSRTDPAVLILMRRNEKVMKRAGVQVRRCIGA